MKKSETLVMVVYYKGAERYASDYFKSIENQSTKQFDLLIIYDNVASFKISGLNVSINEIMISERKKPSMIRLDGMRYALENNYRNLIFSDIDDYFSNNRISLSVRELEEYSFVFNEISLINQNGGLLKENYLHQISVLKYVDSFSHILDYNCLGLTHTGVNLELIDNFYIPEDIIAVDWWVFTILLLNGATGKYVDNATTYYRQSDNNMVGMNKLLDVNRLETGIKVKLIHYDNVMNYCNENNLHTAYEEYSQRKNKINQLKSAIHDKGFCEKYIETVNMNMNKIYKGWWSEILTLDDWRTYER